MKWLVVGGLVGSLATAHAQAPGTVDPVAPAAAPAARDAAELTFRRDAIRFGDDYRISVSQYGGSVHRDWFAMRGDLDERLDPEDFYRLVDRPDLAEAYAHRHEIMVGGFVVGTLGLAGSVVAYFAMKPTIEDGSCVLGSPSHDTCENTAYAKFDADSHTAMLVWGSLVGVGVVGTAVGWWYRVHTHPVSENEAKRLAEQHNQALRRTLGLPVVDVQVTPVATAASGGFALSGRF